MSAEKTFVEVFEGQAFYALTRILTDSEVAALQADLQTVTMFVYRNVGGTKTLVSEESFVIGDTVFDTLHTDKGWKADSTGWNFRGRVPGAMFTQGSGRYDAELIARLWNDQGTDEPDIAPTLYEITVKPLSSS